LEAPNKILQGLGIPHSALISIIFGMMLLSFPVGVYVVFHTNIGNEITFEYPMEGLDLFAGGINFQVPGTFEIGDAFVVLWSIYAVLFAVATVGPCNGFLKTLTHTLSTGKVDTTPNYMFSFIKWFSILILVSGLIDFIQRWFGIETMPPLAENDLVQFYQITLAPLTEEIGFRVALIGLPLFAIFSHKASVKHFFKSLWHPRRNLFIYNRKKVFIIIFTVGIFFGFAHIISGEPWTHGKVIQATAGGIILGWVYFRFGLIAAILVHWSTNYFVYAYANMIAQINTTSVQEAFTHPMFDTMELIFVISGVLSVVVLIIDKINSRTKPKLQV